MKERREPGSVGGVGMALRDPGVREAGVAHLTDAADAHVQGVGAAASPIQDLGSQLHHQALSPSVTLERAGGNRIVVPGKPFVVTALILDVVVGGALLGSEVLGIRRAVLRAEEMGHTRITQPDRPPQGRTTSQGSHETRPHHRPLPGESPHFFTLCKSSLLIVLL